MVQFTTFARTNSVLTTAGVVRDLVGTDGTLSIIPKNFKDSSKRVALVLTKADGTSAMISCSKAVSDGLRDKSIKMSNVASFEVLENEEGLSFICLPATGGALVNFAVKDLKLENYVPAAVNFEQLIAL
jgi:hypothetical protein